MAIVDFAESPTGDDLAYLRDGSGEDVGRTGFFWLGGFVSTMQGAKAEALADLARSTRRPSLRFDYSGHGSSTGMFADGTISLWLDQALHMFLTKASGKRIIVGSSMGGWLALLLVRALQNEDPAALKRIAGLVLIAPATDMTRNLMWDTYGLTIKNEFKTKGFYLQPSGYDNPYTITAKLIEDGERHCLLPKGLSLPFPTRILQGSEDQDVPPAHAVKTFEAMRGPDVSLTFVKGGDHRLSSPTELTLIRETALRLAERADGINV
jgi:pimeloyl-ACP methyl ester carboxylesterase